MKTILISAMMLIATIIAGYNYYINIKDEQSIECGEISERPPIPNLNYSEIIIKREIGHHSMVQKASGEYIIIYRTTPIWKSGNGNVYAIMSTDLNNWSEPKIILEEFINRNTSFIKSHFISLPNGSMMLLYDNDNDGTTWVSFSNNGLNWSLPSSIEVESDRNGYWRVSFLAVLSDGYIYALSPAKTHGSQMRTNIHRSPDGLAWDLVTTIDGVIYSIARKSDGEFVAVGQFGRLGNNDVNRCRYPLIGTSSDGIDWNIKNNAIPVSPRIISSRNGSLYIGGLLFVEQTSDIEVIGPNAIIYSNNSGEWSTPNVFPTAPSGYGNFFQNIIGQLVMSYSDGIVGQKWVYIIIVDPNDIVIEY